MAAVARYPRRDTLDGLAEDARFIARGGEAATERAAWFRREQPCVDNAFADDPGYSRELALQIKRIQARASV